jgi:hypothetical protein
MLVKTIEIPKIDQFSDINFEHSSMRNRACYFLLTCLALAKTGAIFAKWKKDDSSVSWRFSEDSTFIFETPEKHSEILRVPSVGVFRSMLARLGNASIGEVYLGAGIFDIVFEDKQPLDNRFVIVFSNERQTGYWIKLQSLTRFKPDAVPDSE